MSCQAGACLAIGSYSPYSGGESYGLAVTWNGRTLKSIPAPPASGGENIIDGLSCVSARDCITMISSMDSESSVIDTWNGSVWKESTIAWPQGTSLSMLFGVSCTSAESCLAVGTAGPASTGLSAAAVSCNGKTWVRQTDVLQPGNGNSDYFGDVSCPTANDCITAGQIGLAPFYYATPIFGSWNGKSWRGAYS